MVVLIVICLITGALLLKYFSPKVIVPEETVSPPEPDARQVSPPTDTPLISPIPGATAVQTERTNFTPLTGRYEFTCPTCNKSYSWSIESIVATDPVFTTTCLSCGAVFSVRNPRAISTDAAAVFGEVGPSAPLSGPAGINKNHILVCGFLILLPALFYFISSRVLSGTRQQASMAPLLLLLAGMLAILGGFLIVKAVTLPNDFVAPAVAGLNKKGFMVATGILVAGVISPFFLLAVWLPWVMPSTRSIVAKPKGPA